MDFLFLNNLHYNIMYESVRSFLKVLIANVNELIFVTFCFLFHFRAALFKTGSDYMPFFADLGIPSMDFRFTFDAVSYP